MKPVTKYLLIAGTVLLVLLTAGMIVLYQEYMGEDADPSSDKNTNPIINKRINAVVTNKSVIGTNSSHSLKIDFTDIDTRDTASLMLNDQYGNSIAIGDTLTKDKGEKIVLISRKSGIMSVPVE